jgi:DNA repair protein RecO (recombination protein O)
MAEFRTQALVLRTFDQGESDRLVHLYTEDLGRISAIAKGARRSRKRFPGRLEILTLLDIRVVDPPRSSLMRLEGARLVTPFESFTADLGRYAIACQLLEVLDRFTGEREPNPDLFHFITGVLGVVADEAPDRLLALLVLAKTLARLGYRPQLTSCASCGRAISARGPRVGFEPRHGGTVCPTCCESEDVRIAPRLVLALDAGIRTPLRERAQLGLSPREVEIGERLLGRFLRFFIGLELRTAPFLSSVLEHDGRSGARGTP